MNKKQIPVENLRPGMYLAELDGPWLGFPFALGGFPVASTDANDVLIRHGKTVFIDLDWQAGNNQCRRHAGVRTWSCRAEGEAIESAWPTDNGCRQFETIPVEQELSEST